MLCIATVRRVQKKAPPNEYSAHLGASLPKDTTALTTRPPSLAVGAATLPSPVGRRAPCKRTTCQAQTLGVGAGRRQPFAGQSLLVLKLPAMPQAYTFAAAELGLDKSVEGPQRLP